MKKNSIYMWQLTVFCIIFSIALYLMYALYSITKLPKSEIANVRSESIMVIVDAGHGGKDGGAVGISGLLEKDLNLQVAQSLFDMLTACGINAVMTRTEDSLVCDEDDPSIKGKLKQNDLRNRWKIAESNPDAIFVSIHMNNFPIEKYSGLQVYYSKNCDASFEVAKTIQDRVALLLQPENDRKIKAAGSNIYLLDRITSPAVLVECGFLSNYAESKKLSSQAYRTKLALIIMDSIIANMG